jgi:hypothetical protein
VSAQERGGLRLNANGAERKKKERKKRQTPVLLNEERSVRVCGGVDVEKTTDLGNGIGRDREVLGVPEDDSVGGFAPRGEDGRCCCCYCCCGPCCYRWRRKRRYWAWRGGGGECGGGAKFIAAFTREDETDGRRFGRGGRGGSWRASGCIEKVGWDDVDLSNAATSRRWEGMLDRAGRGHGVAREKTMDDGQEKTDKYLSKPSLFVSTEVVLGQLKVMEWMGEPQDIIHRTVQGDIVTSTNRRRPAFDCLSISSGVRDCLCSRLQAVYVVRAFIYTPHSFFSPIQSNPRSILPFFPPSSNLPDRSTTL